MNKDVEERFTEISDIGGHDATFEETFLNAAGTDIVTRKKKFLFKILILLHASGNLSFRTEEYIRNCARAFGMHATCSVFPVAAMLSIHESPNLDLTSNSNSYTIAISPGYKVATLCALDNLCYSIKSGKDFEEAEKVLHAIENAPEL